MKALSPTVFILFLLFVSVVHFTEVTKIMTSDNNSNMTDIELWYIPMDILRVVCTGITIIIDLIFLALIAFKKTCRTVPMMLVVNTAEFVCVCTVIGLVAFTFENNLKKN
jgi:hypothetical protein